MSQYWIVVNLDRKEFFAPDGFDGPQLCSWSDTTAKGIALLTSCGNGRGGGDLTLPFDNVLDTPPPGTSLLDGTWTPRNTTPAPEFLCMGTWAGNRILTIGDCCEEELFMTPEQIKDCRKRYKQWLTNHDTRRTGEKTYCRLFWYAMLTFSDVTQDVLVALGATGYGPLVKTAERWDRLLGKHLQDRLYDEYQEGRDKRDLWWLGVAELDRIILDVGNCGAALTHFKAWLKRQMIPRIIRDLLPTYKPSGWDYDHRRRILDRYRHVNSTDPSDIYSTRKLLPVLPPEPEPLPEAPVRTQALGLRELALEPEAKE